MEAPAPAEPLAESEAEAEATVGGAPGARLAPVQAGRSDAGARARGPEPAEPPLPPPER